MKKDTYRNRKINKKTIKIMSIIAASIVVVVGSILLIGYFSESKRQERVLNKVDLFVKSKGFVGKEAGSDYAMTLTFHNTEEDKLTINFAKENEGQYYLTFKGTYRLYFEEDKLMMEVVYAADGLSELVFQSEIFNVKYNKKGEITSLINIDDKGQTSTFTLQVG